MRDGHRRSFFRRFVSILACVVVFCTTYALLLPAITLEKTATCGIEEHQHDDSCYENKLTCGLKETEGHSHTEDCYDIHSQIICKIEEHAHTGTCFDKNGNLTCALEEHTHDSGCFREDRILSCKKEEAEPHHHSDACYEKVLTCLKDIHTHSAACYPVKGEAQVSVSEEADVYSTEEAESPVLDDNDIPPLFQQMLTDATSLYTLSGDTPSEDMLSGNEEEDEEAVWTRVDENDIAEIHAADTVRLYYAFTIPAGTLDASNAEFRFPLPSNVHLTDEQIETNNSMNDGRGAQALEGTRTPDEAPTDPENVSAWVTFENVYDNTDDDTYEDIEAKSPALLEQDVVLTFDEYSIEKNRKTYDNDGALISDGEKINGFFSIDVTADQIRFDQNDENLEAQITLVEKDSELDIEPICRTLRLVEEDDTEEEESEEKQSEEKQSEEKESEEKESKEKESEEEAEEELIAEAGNDLEETAEEEERSDPEEETEEETGKNLEDVTEVEAESDSEEKQEAEAESNPKEEIENGTGENPEKTSSAGTLTFEGSDYTVLVSYTEDAGIPEDASLVVSEIREGSDEYNTYRAQAEDAIAAGGLSWIRLFDISIEVDGKPFEPAAPVSVQINYHEAIEQEQNTEVNTVHFEGSKETPKLLDTEAEGSENTTEQVSFETDGFSVFAIVGTVIEKTVLASDGKNYHITATYGVETGIPMDADLAVEEITNTSSVYDEYVLKTENALGMKEGSAGYIRLFDIKIVDKNDLSVKYQPASGTTVDVRIELDDSESRDLSIVHFVDDTEDGEKIECRTETADSGQSVSFAADGFSVYAIVEGDQSTGETYSIKYTFVLEDGTPFYFTNKNGDTTNVQYVKDGEIPINPGTPTASTGEQADKEFAGWWTKNGTAWGTELSFDTPVSTSSLQEITVYARYDNTQYITYYDENGTVYLVDRRHENDTVLTTDVKNPATGEKWTEQELEDYRFVSYLPLSKTTAFLGWTQTQGKTTPDDNFTITEATTLYPVIAEVKWVTYHSGPTGSNATYFGAEYALDGNWDRNNLADHIPTRAGYQFDGWYIRNTATQGDNDNLDYSWTLSSADVRVTDANGNFDNSFKNNSAYFENGKLKNDIELVVHWTPTTVNYVFVYYQQEPNANDDGSYDYVYKDSQTASGIAGTNTGTPPVPAWDDINGFSLHNTNDTEDPYNVKTQVIQGDGSTVVKVYYDRNTYTVTFFEHRKGSGYVLNDDEINNNNVYGYSDGEFAPLTREEQSVTTWVLSQYNYGSTAYTGTIYSDMWRTVATNPTYGDGKTYYRRRNSVSFTQLYWRPSTSTISTWKITSTGEIYTGNRFIYTNNSNSNQWFAINDLMIEAKYGEDVSQLWPDKRDDLDEDYPQQWYTSKTGSVMQSGIQLMPPNNQMFYNRPNSGVENHLIYWLQDLPLTPEGTAPNIFTNVRDDTIYGNSLTTTWDDYSIYEGFKINIRTQDVTTLNNNNGADVAATNNNYSMSAQIGSSFSSGTNRTLNIYYLRNKYSITFQQGNIVIGSDEYYYEADISNADKYSSAVNVPAGMRFVGWYDNPEGIGEKYTFDGKTMPPNNLILYAKLVPEEYYVRLDYNGGETKGSESTFAWVDYGETIEEAEDVKRNYVAVADGETGTHNYVYWRYDEAADAAGDGWWSYYLDADGNVVYNDPKDYSQRTASYIEAAGGKYKYDPGKYTFIGWYETDEAGNQISNVPFNFATRITKDTYLKAIFRKEGIFQVRYLPNMGNEGTEGYVAGDPNTAPPTDAYTYIDLSEAKVGHSIEPADEKYQFAGWRVKGTTGPVYQPGETFPINSDYAEEENGVQYITLEPVFIQKGDTRITYEVNTPAGGTATGTTLNDLTNNTQEKLILDGSVTLHDGDGFAVTGYKLIGWSDKPLQPSQNPIHLKDDGTYEGTIPSDTHIFKPGGKYGVSDEEGNTLYAVWELLTIPVPFTKKGENNLGEYEQLAGAQFKLYTDEDCHNLISDTFNEINENEATAVSSDENGINVIFPKVPAGTYYFKETYVDDRYKLDGTVHTIEVTESEDGSHTLSYKIDGSSGSLVIKNHLKGTLVITKTVDSVVAEDSQKTFSFTAVVAGTPIPDGKYGDLSFVNNTAAFTLKHNEEVKIRNLVGRQITVTENDAVVYTTTAIASTGSSENYNADSKSYTITIPNDGDTVAFTNKLEGVPVKAVKTDQSGNALAGAVFSGDFITDTITTELSGPDDEKEAVIFNQEAVAIGEYTLHEDTAPSGYNQLPGDVTIEVTQNSTTGQILVSAKVGGEDSAFAEAELVDSSDLSKGWIVTIRNDAGVVLPSTGGPGIRLFKILGTILIAGAGLLLWRRGRRKLL